MNNVTVMYHYVRDSTRMKAFSVEQFRQQVKYLKSKYETLSLSEMLDYQGSKPTCVLTFDDGVKDAVTNILPILNEFKIKGVFLVPGSIIEQKRVLNVQKRHLLLGEIGTEQLVREFNIRLPKELEIKAGPIFKADYMDDLLTCSLKWMLDFADYEIVGPVLDDIFGKYFEEEVVFDELYLSHADMHALLAEGMELGMHGYTHRQLGILYFKDQEAEIRTGTEAIRKVIEDRPLYMSYPSGSYTPLTIRLLEKYHYRAALTIKKHHNNQNTPLYELGRYDCTEASNL